MSDKLTERLRVALAQVVNDIVAEEFAACEADLNRRIGDASRDEADHKNDPIEVRRELAGYARGLRDAYFVLRNRHKT